MAYSRNRSVPALADLNGAAVVPAASRACAARPKMLPDLDVAGGRYTVGLCNRLRKWK